MNGWIEAPPPRRGLGCFARGCLILVVFGVVLALACFAGLYWGSQRHSAITHGIYWLAKTHSIAEAPAPVPEFAASDEQIQAIEERWHEFEQRARAGQTAEIVLTADDINTLIAANRDPRWKAFVSMEENRLRLQASVPLGEFFGWPRYYFNGDILTQSDGAQSLEPRKLSAQLGRVMVNNRPVPKDFLNWKYRSRRLRDYLGDYRNSYDVGTVEVRGGKLILQSGSE
jgi:hypothetical protein